ncbi:MAG: leucine-rich repeat domain-containing protein, partial [Clostridia bacterium]|nr:leucine-rich repeat domain-containing protein [Clostridia bacterium]
MKKLLALLLALLMVASMFVGCDTTNDETPSTNDSQQTPSGSNGSVDDPDDTTGGDSTTGGNDINDGDETVGGGETTDDASDGDDDTGGDDTVGDDDTTAPPSEGLKFVLNDDGETCTLVSIGTCTDTEIVIPSTSPDGYKVTVIGSAALLRQPITSVTIPNSIILIEKKAFEGCTSLVNVKIPSSVIELGQDAFFGCSSLQSVSISASKIGSSAFRSCSSLTSVKFSSEVKEIGNQAFESCKGLTEIIIPNGVQVIGSRAFALCEELSEIILPDSITKIREDAFLRTKYTTDISTYWTDDVLYIGNHLIKAKTRVLDYTVRPGTKIIADKAFESVGLQSISIPGSVTTIGECAFLQCSNLTTVTLSEGVSQIGMSAFYGCTNLTTIHIPNSVTVIEGNAFYH